MTLPRPLFRAWLASLALVLSACATVVSIGPKVPFTQEIRGQYGIKEKDLQQMQFYTSASIVLRRRLPHGKYDVVKGTLRVIDDHLYDEVIVQSGTRGLAVDANRHSLKVSFEQPGKEGGVLQFGALSDGVAAGEYRLYGRDWTERTAVVRFEGEDYLAVDGSGDAYLMIDLSVLQRFETQRRVLPGRSLPRNDTKPE